MYSNMVNSRKRSPNDCDKEQSDNYPCQEKPLKLVKREIVQQQQEEEEEDDEVQDRDQDQDQRNVDFYRMDDEQDDDFDDDEDDDVYDTNEVKIYSFRCKVLGSKILS